jgi:hypothetical protein
MVDSLVQELFGGRTEIKKKGEMIRLGEGWIHIVPRLNEPIKYLSVIPGGFAQRYMIY